MRALVSSELGRGIGGVLISIGLTMVVLLPVVIMEICTRIFDLV